jgi:hypothetical protein
MLLQQIHSALKGDRKAVELLLRMEAAVAAGPEHAPLFSAAEDLEILRSFADKVVTKGDSDE